MQSAASELPLIEAAAREAGAVARSLFGTNVATWSKGEAGPVSEADIAVNVLLRERLRGTRPDYGWLSEESPDDPARLAKRRVWVVDPIDGTQEFIAGRPDFVISIGLVEDGTALAGVVHNPITGETWSGACGAEARLDGALIRASERGELAGAALIGKKRFYEPARWAAPWPELELSFRPAIAHRLALVAAGAFDGLILPPFKHEWDIAGGAAILAAAGARVTDLWGGALSFNQPDPRMAGLVAAGPALHALLIERTARSPDPRETSKQAKDAAS